MKDISWDFRSNQFFRLKKLNQAGSNEDSNGEASSNEDSGGEASSSEDSDGEASSSDASGTEASEADLETDKKKITSVVQETSSGTIAGKEGMEEQLVKNLKHNEVCVLLKCFKKYIYINLDFRF